MEYAIRLYILVAIEVVKRYWWAILVWGVLLYLASVGLYSLFAS